MTTHKGIARGRSIELDQPLPYTEGQALRVTVEPEADNALRHADPAESWREFLDETYGSCANLDLQRHRDERNVD